MMWCPVMASRKPPQAPCSSQAATLPAASEAGPNTPPPAKRTKCTKAEQAAEPSQPTKGEGKANRLCGLKLTACATSHSRHAPRSSERSKRKGALLTSLRINDQSIGKVCGMGCLQVDFQWLGGYAAKRCS
ncbi:hypothetical protein QJQ45_008454 [Haematococcus lacustris]|nr:hypothetical protein QJQ45_008454 [Haematococcus lacustris]